MIIPEISVKRPVLTVMIVSALIVFGVIGFERLGISQYPDVEFPSISITTALTGASPEVVDKDITDVIEEQISTIQGVKHITSMSLYGMSRIVVEFEIERNIDIAASDVREQVAYARMFLPRDIDPPIIMKDNPMDQPIMWVACLGNRQIQDISDFAENTMKPRLQTLKGVGSIFIAGKRERTIRIWIDPQRLESYGLTVLDISNALTRSNVEFPGGTLETAAVEKAVKTLGEIKSVEEFDSIVVNFKDGVPVYLKDIASIEDGLADKRMVTKYNGKTSIGIGIRKQRGANTVAVADAIKKELAKIEKDNLIPEGIGITIAFDASGFIRESISEIEFAVIVGGLLAAFIVFVFLRSIGSTLIISIAIPTSLIGTFAFMYFFGFTLNTMTLMGMSLSVGVVIDDAIIILENIYRHREQGAKAIEGAITGASEITFAAMAATFSLAAVFIPIAFIKGMIGRFFYEFGLTVAISILLSLVVALTLTPMLCSRFLNVKQSSSLLYRSLEAIFQKMEHLYKTILGICMENRLIVVVFSIAVLISSVLIAKRLGSEMFPSEDMSLFIIKFESPVGTSIEYNETVLHELEKIMIETKEVKGFFEALGMGPGGVGQVNQGLMFVSMTPIKERKRSQTEVMNDLRPKLNQIPGTYVKLIDLSSAFGMGITMPVDFNLKGTDLDKLEEYSKQFTDKMRSLGGYTDIDTDYDKGVPEVRIYPNSDKAADMGVDKMSIGTVINYLVAGKNVTKFKDKGNQYDIRIQLKSDFRREPQDLKNISIRSSKGTLVKLSDVVTLQEGGGSGTIFRKDRERSINITAGLEKTKPQGAALDEIEKTAAEILPPGYHVSHSGKAESFKESMPSMLFALVLSILITYMILASQFNSFLHPFTIMLALPLSLIGAFGSLYIAGATISIISMIGLILLMGLVTKNSILLVDYTNQLRAKGMDCRSAVLTASPVRLRPILMTALSTMFGVIPVIFGIGPGSESRIPMGIAVGGGMLTSTMLTLFVVPVVYTILDDAVNLFRK
ncbi:MAG: efflux RND transporter permease subunit [Planctomycetes bacterium]|nr:efflux RND transporter permease subunit [Planctomycetota bacterium]